LIPATNGLHKNKSKHWSSLFRFFFPNFYFSPSFFQTIADVNLLEKNHIQTQGKKRQKKKTQDMTLGEAFWISFFLFSVRGWSVILSECNIYRRVQWVQLLWFWALDLWCRR